MKFLYTLLFFLAINSTNTYAQTTPVFYVDVPSGAQDEVFDRVVMLFLESTYFVESVDKQAGFIQSKTTEDYKRIFTTRDGIVVRYNLLLRQHESQGIRINIQANLMEKKRTGSTSAVGYHNNDLGVTSDPKYYEGITNFLKENLMKE